METYLYKENKPKYTDIYLRNLIASKALSAPIIVFPKKLGKAILFKKPERNLYSAEVNPPLPPQFSQADSKQAEIPTVKIAKTKDTSPSSVSKISFFIVNPTRFLNSNNSLSRPYLTLDYIPRELSYSPRSTFSAIKILGRNNPNYHYGGSEDSLSFEIDWYLYSDFRQGQNTILDKCRKLEALSKANGHTSPPPIIYLKWGSEDLFFNSFWIVASAPYKLKQFSKYSLYTEGKVRGVGDLMPHYATQVVTLKRVTGHSLTHEEIRTYPKSV